MEPSLVGILGLIRCAVLVELTVVVVARGDVVGRCGAEVGAAVGT